MAIQPFTHLFFGPSSLLRTSRIIFFWFSLSASLLPLRIRLPLMAPAISLMARGTWLLVLVPILKSPELLCAVTFKTMIASLGVYVRVALMGSSDLKMMAKVYGAGRALISPGRTQLVLQSVPVSDKFSTLACLESVGAELLTRCSRKGVVDEAVQLSRCEDGTYCTRDADNINAACCENNEGLPATLNGAAIAVTAVNAIRNPQPSPTSSPKSSDAVAAGSGKESDKTTLAASLGVGIPGAIVASAGIIKYIRKRMRRLR